MHRRQTGGEILGCQDIGRFVHQITGEEHAFAERGQGRGGGGHSFGAGAGERDGAKVFFLARLMGGEVIGPHRKSEGNLGRLRVGFSQHMRAARAQGTANGGTGLARL